MDSTSRSHPLASFFNEQVYQRGQYLIEIPVSLITSTLATVSAIPFATLAIVFGGLSGDAMHLGRTLLPQSKNIIRKPFYNLLHFINPKAESVRDEKFGPRSPVCIGHKLKKSNNILVRHVVSRLSFALDLVAEVVRKAVFGVLGAIAAVFSLMTLGISPSLNKFAYKGLKAPGVIGDIFRGVQLIINPWVSMDNLKRDAQSKYVFKDTVAY